MCTVVSLPHLSIWISWGWTFIRLQLTWRYPDHRRDLGPGTWRYVHWQIEKATVLGEGYLRLRIAVLHDRLIYKYISDSKVGFFFMLTLCLHTHTNNYTILKSCMHQDGFPFEFPGVDATPKRQSFHHQPTMPILPHLTGACAETAKLLASAKLGTWDPEGWELEPESCHGTLLGIITNITSNIC